MPNEKIKTYKNIARNATSDYKPYVPQYQVLGVEPGEYKSAVLPDNTKVADKPQEDNPRQRKAIMRQPYAESTPSPVGRGKGPIPNVGNNMEHMWSSVDGEIIDDLSNGDQLDSNHAMIDNNYFVSSAALGFNSEELSVEAEQLQVEQPFNKGFSESQIVSSPSSEDDLFPIVRDLEEGSYLLIVNGVPVCSGPKEEIEEQAKSFIFGEHEMCGGAPIPDSDLVIVKRIPIKIGLFIE